MDEFVQRILRKAKSGDTDAWIQIENALQRQLIDLRRLPIFVVTRFDDVY